MSGNRTPQPPPAFDSPLHQNDIRIIAGSVANLADRSAWSTFAGNGLADE
jgi:hypothetical protein